MPLSGVDALERLIAKKHDLKQSAMPQLLTVRPGSDGAKRAVLLDDWYRAELKHAVAPLITKWAPLLGVKVNKFFVQH